MIIAVDIPRTYPPVWETAAGAVKYAAENGDVRIVFPDRKIAQALNAACIPWNGRDSWDGAIVPFYRDDLSVPQVVVSPYAPAGEVIVTMDDDAIAGLAVDRFIAMGLRHFAFLGDPAWELSDYRWQPFSAQLAAQGFEASYIPRQAMAATLEALPKPCGILSFNDTLGIELLNVCRETGFRVPDEIYVIAVDDSPECMDVSPALASISLPTSRAGYAAARLCKRLIKGQPADSLKIQPAGLILRESVQVQEKDIHTASAIAHFLRTNLTEAIQMDDLVRRSELSRRRLEQLFRSTYEASPMSYLKNLRLKKAQQLLRTTTGPLQDIVDACGYSDVNHLCRVFRDHVGETPRHYREKRLKTE